MQRRILQPDESFPEDNLLKKSSVSEIGGVLISLCLVLAVGKASQACLAHIENEDDRDYLERILPSNIIKSFTDEELRSVTTVVECYDTRGGCEKKIKGIELDGSLIVQNPFSDDILKGISQNPGKYNGFSRETAQAVIQSFGEFRIPIEYMKDSLNKPIEMIPISEEDITFGRKV